MKINIEETSSVERKLNVEIPWDQVQDEIVRVLVRIQKKADLKGFRKGKAPIEMVKRHFSEDAKQEAVNNLVASATRKVLDENSLEPLGNPYLTDVRSEDNEPLVFEAMVELTPDFELAEYKGLELEKPVQKVTGSDVDDFIQSMRERRAETVPVIEDRVLKGDDAAEIDFKASRNGEPVEGMGAQNYIVRLGHSELIPGFEEQIVGMKSGQTRSFDLPFPEEFPNKDLAGQTVTFEVMLRQLREIKVPDLDDEFVKSISDHETVDALKNMIHKDLEKLRAEEAEKSLRSNLAARLVEHNEFEVPPTIVDKELRYLVNDYGQNLLRSGMPEDKIQEFIMENEEHLKKTAEENVRLVYIINSIAEKEEIQASREKVEGIVMEGSARTGQTFEDLMKKYSEDGTLNDIAYGVVREEVFNILTDSARIKEIEVVPGEAAGSSDAPAKGKKKTTGKAGKKGGRKK